MDPYRMLVKAIILPQSRYAAHVNASDCAASEIDWDPIRLLMIYSGAYALSTRHANLAN